MVALAGATGSGKSTLFNALAGTELSKPGVTRPTTSVTHACVWGEPASELLDWLGVNVRHHRETADEELAGLVLLDLPDHDSTRVEHRLEVDRLVDLVDLLVWVVDPEKYADAAIHDGYLRPLAGHAEVMLVVLNQLDRLTPEDRPGCLADLGRLLQEDGLGAAPVLGVSAKTGDGMGALVEELQRRVDARTAAMARLSADLDAAAAALMGPTGTAGGRVDGATRDELITALTLASGADLVGAAVAASHRRDGRGATGWPFSRWLRRFRPDPLERLHLGRSGSTARPSLPEPGPPERSRVRAAVRSAADSGADGLPDPWPMLARNAPATEDDLHDALRQAVATADLGLGRNPRWWTVVSTAQRVLAAAAAIGALWLLALFGFAYLRLPDPPTPSWGPIPVPTALLLGGLGGGVVLSLWCRSLVRIGADRRRRRAMGRLGDQLGQVADRTIIEPIETELATVTQIRTAATRAQSPEARAAPS